MDEKKLREFILISALENAIKFKGKANQGAIVGKLFVYDPSLKENMKEVMPILSSIIKETNSLSQQEQEKKLLELVPDYFESEKQKKTERKKEARELPPLKDAEDGKVVTRMPPGPSKYPHIGHAISFGINYLYAKSYNGKCILRFDDTNPEVEKQEYVTAIKEDVIDYMGMKPDEIIFASDYIDDMYALVEDVIKDGKAYACSCESEKIAENRRNCEECPHRNQLVDETFKIWNGMKKGDNSECALRLKIDMKHKNAVMRDPVIFRVIKTEHYRQKNKYKVWPTYDFESPIVDGINKITHVLRSNEFDTRIELHNYISKLFGFGEIYYKHYGRANIVGSLTQGREIRNKIETGEYIGWDDPRLVTLKALKRRGIVRDAILNVVKMSGLSKQNTNIDFSVISAENRKILDEKAKRFFFIKSASKIHINSAPNLELELNMHPSNRDGGRKFSTSNDFYIEKEDLDKINDNEITRLMDCLNFIKDGDVFNFHSLDHLEFKKKGKNIIHWLPINENSKLIDVEIMMPNAEVIKGLSEPNLEKISIGDVIQFERFGFCKLDSIKNKKYLFWFTHD